MIVEIAVRGKSKAVVTDSRAQKVMPRWSIICVDVPQQHAVILFSRLFGVSLGSISR
jgi:hypothetical protein